MRLSILSLLLLLSTNASAADVFLGQEFIQEEGVNVREHITTIGLSMKDGDITNTVSIGQGGYDGYILSNNQPLSATSRHFRFKTEYDVNDMLTLNASSWVRDIAPSTEYHTREVMLSLGAQHRFGPIRLEGGITHQKTGVGSFDYPYARLGGDIKMNGGLYVKADITRTMRSREKQGYYQPAFTILTFNVGMPF